MAARTPSPNKRPKQKAAIQKTRTLKQSRYKSFRLHKRIKHPNTKLPKARLLFKRAIITLRANWRLFGGIALVYMLLNIVLVRGFSNTLQLSELKGTLNEAFAGDFGQLTTGVALFGYILGSSGSGLSEVGGLYQSLLLILLSLATIWALRQTYAKARVSVKESYYKSTYPIIPFLLVLFVIGLQLVPLLIGNSLYGTVVTNGLAVTAPEKVIWAIIYFLLALLSFYMVCSSIFALYIVTLSNMTPMKALRSARQLVLHRRWLVLRKLLFLPFMLLIFSALIIVPMIIIVTPVAEWGFFALSTFSILIIHSYIYGLYRELL